MQNKPQTHEEVYHEAFGLSTEEAAKYAAFAAQKVNEPGNGCTIPELKIAQMRIQNNQNDNKLSWNLHKDLEGLMEVPGVSIGKLITSGLPYGERDREILKRILPYRIAVIEADQPERLEKAEASRRKAAEEGMHTPAEQHLDVETKRAYYNANQGSARIDPAFNLAMEFMDQHEDMTGRYMTLSMRANDFKVCVWDGPVTASADDVEPLLTFSKATFDAFMSGDYSTAEEAEVNEVLDLIGDNLIICEMIGGFLCDQGRISLGRRIGTLAKINDSIQFALSDARHGGRTHEELMRVLRGIPQAVRHDTGRREDISLRHVEVEKTAKDPEAQLAARRKDNYDNSRAREAWAEIATAVLGTPIAPSQAPSNMSFQELISNDDDALRAAMAWSALCEDDGMTLRSDISDTDVAKACAQLVA